MAYPWNCRCDRCRIRGLTGPAVLITIGVLFLIHQSAWGWDWGIGRTWPVILLVIGLVKLAEAMASTEGHIGRQGPMPPGTVPPGPMPPPNIPPPAPPRPPAV